MPNRTVKCYGKAYGDSPVTVKATFNNTVVHSATVSTVSGSPDRSIQFDNLDNLFEFTLDTSINGSIPFKLEVTGGSLIWNTLHANYVIPETEDLINDSAVWPSYVPATAAEIKNDSSNLSDADFNAKYGADKIQLEFDNVDFLTIVTSASARFDDLSEINNVDPDLNRNPITSDGHDNVQIDGVSYPRNADASTSGTWNWYIEDGEVFTCDVFVDEAVTDDAAWRTSQINAMKTKFGYTPS